LVLARADVPRVIDWKRVHQAIERFMDEMPFRIRPDRLVRKLAAGEKQKLEILKQLYVGSRIVILDEPTSVLTPSEADEVLGMLGQMAREGRVSVAMITHKFREVLAYSDEVTVLRRGRLAGTGKTSELTAEAMAEMMVGAEVPRASLDRSVLASDAPLLELDRLCANDDLGLGVLSDVSFGVAAGEIVGIAGVSGNGQEARREHTRERSSFRHRDPEWGGRIHLRRGDGDLQLDRGLSRRAAQQAAVSDAGGPLWPADAGQQRGDARKHSAHRAARGRGIRARRRRAVDGDEALLRERQRGAPRDSGGAIRRHSPRSAGYRGRSCRGAFAPVHSAGRRRRIVRGAR
jgi:energy-coupling factor transporter ATP-binding protein EcfA2